MMISNQGRIELKSETWFDTRISSRTDRYVACVTVDGNTPPTMLMAFRDDLMESKYPPFFAQFVSDEGTKICMTLKDLVTAVELIKKELAEHYQLDDLFLNK